ncbi:MAG TPA: FAD-dependent oxidoreductase, partial [Phycisphaerae bacterium]|nr:FAD-dependent oxidoreductase [Phycisphaerae bacterium]
MTTITDGGDRPAAAARARGVLLAAWAVLSAAAPAARAQGPEPYDVVVYGGTAGGVIAAIQAANMGKSVVLIEPTQRLGGMTTNGLSSTDAGKADAIQGLAREFYTRVGQEYGSGSPVWNFEPHVAEGVLDDWVAEAGVTVVRGQRLDLEGGVAMAGSVIETIRMESGRMFAADVFIDAGYEGDLMAHAGVTYAVGRESNATYGETYNGVQTARATSHQFSTASPVDPYVVPGDPASGLLPLVGADPPGIDGQGDHRVQAYNFRLTVTQAANRRPWTAPPGYDPATYELLRRHIAATSPSGIRSLMNLGGLRNGKYDMNNNGAVSTDFIGMNYDYPEGDY